MYGFKVEKCGPKLVDREINNYFCSLNKYANEEDTTTRLFASYHSSCLRTAEHADFPKHHYSNIAFGGKLRAADSLRVTPLNIGLWNHVDTLEGFQLGILKSGVGSYMKGFSIGGLLNADLGSSDGVQASGILSLVIGRMRGLQLGAVNVAHYQHGLQIGLLSNISVQPLRGVQIVGVTNVARGMAAYKSAC